MKKLSIIFSICSLVGSLKAQLTPLPGTENYIQTKTYLDYNGASVTKSSETVQYFDGLGRPKQTVGVKVSPLGKDVVTVIEYDPEGRQAKEYLPVPQGGTLNGAITPNPLSNLAATPYGNEKIYSEKVFENSPLDRVLDQKQVGNDWNTKPVTFGYEGNSALDKVIRFTAPSAWINNATESKTINNGIYGDAQLYKNTVTDEDGNRTIEFKNGEGQLLLLRKVISSTENADTYYVYNDYDQLSSILSPKALDAVKDIAPGSEVSSTVLNNLCYQYKYDSRNRLVEKKLPGKDWEYLIYNKADQLVMTQDTVLKGKGQWLFTKYDQYGRPVYTGITNNPASRASMQNSVNTNYNIYETRTTTAGFTLNGLPVYYTKLSTPTGLSTLLSVTYYDTYPAGSPAVTNVFSQPLLTDDPAQERTTKGLLTATYTKNIENDSWTKNFIWYDNKGRNIGSRNNDYLGGYTVINNKLDFSGNILQTNTYQRLGTAAERIIVEKFTYDAQNRLLTKTHQVGSNPVEFLAQNTYNEISQLESKKVGGTTSASPLQILTYGYNIRGWLTKVNDPSNLNGKLFGYELKYNNPAYSSLSPGKYNGNIAEIDWRGVSDGIFRRYNYQYDRLDRLKSGIYSEPNNTVAPQNNYFNEALTYDLNGNIQSLKRNSYLENVGLQLMDDLSYTYTGNRLDKVVDSSGNSSGYPDTSGNTIAYDSNGNMTSHLDKGIRSIAYNYLNLPNALEFEGEYISQDTGSLKKANTQYIYNADGTKLRKVYTYGLGKGKTETSIKTDYLNGFQFTNDVLSFVPTSEGYYDFVQNKYIYNYTDQLGNIRLAYYKDASGNLKIDRTTHYYPFGLEFGGDLSTVNSISPDYRYSSQGQENQEETRWISFKWRNYDSAMGRFLTIDPLSEKYAYQSHYNFSENKVTTYRELEGMESMSEPLDPAEEEMRETGESPLIRQARFNPAVPETFRRGSNEPLITPELMEDKVTEIEEIAVTGRKATKDFFERAVEFVQREVSDFFEIIIDGDKYPESAKHLDDAIKQGKSNEGVIDRAGASERRRENLKGIPTEKRKDRDEAPPAVINTGERASVRKIDKSDNRGAGSSIGHQIKGVPNGTPVRIVPINISKDKKP